MAISISCKIWLPDLANLNKLLRSVHLQMLVDLVESGIFWHIPPDLAKFSRICQILPDFDFENDIFVILSNMDSQMFIHQLFFQFHHLSSLNLHWRPRVYSSLKVNGGVPAAWFQGCIDLSFTMLD